MCRRSRRNWKFDLAVVEVEAGEGEQDGRAALAGLAVDESFLCFAGRLVGAGGGRAGWVGAFDSHCCGAADAVFEVEV